MFKFTLESVTFRILKMLTYFTVNFQIAQRFLSRVSLIVSDVSPKIAEEKSKRNQIRHLRGLKWMEIMKAK